jgi:hypothetical protein
MIGIVVMMMATTIGACLRLEWSRCLVDHATQSTQHVGQYVIDLKAQTAAKPLGQDLYGHMAVAEVVCSASKKQGITRVGFDEVLRRSFDFDHCVAIVGLQPVAVVQMIASFKKDARFYARGERHLEATALAFVVNEGDGIRGRKGRFLGECEHNDSSLRWRRVVVKTRNTVAPWAKP